MFHFKTIMYVVAMAIIKQIVCIATALIMWEMFILPEKEAFREKKAKNLYTKLNIYFYSKILLQNHSCVVAMVICINSG